MAAQYKLKMSDEVRDLIRHLHPDIKQKIHTALTEIIENSICGKALRGELHGLRSLRVSKFRIILSPGGTGHRGHCPRPQA